MRGRDADDARVGWRAVIAEAEAGADLRIAGGGGREDDAHALRAFHYVRVGDDVAVGIHDHAGAEAALAADGVGVGVIFFVERAIAGDLHLHDGGRDAGGEFLQRFVELREEVFAGGFGWGLGFLRIGVRFARGGKRRQAETAAATMQAEQCARCCCVIGCESFLRSFELFLL